MFGIIATIIATKKGHSGYAIFTGIWTAIAIILALTAGPKTVVHGQTTIGRSEDNTIVLPANTAGVSGRHCAITAANGQFYIEDLGSTCGTVGNGVHRLSPNQAVILKAGDRICLGSDQVAFEVSK